MTNRFFYPEKVVINAKFIDVLKWLLTNGKRGKLYTIIDNPPPNHINCKCSIE